MELQTLTHGAVAKVTPNFQLGVEEVDFSRFVAPFHRVLSIDVLAAVIDEAMKKYADDPDASDVWLAPRVHAALRLSRREAGSRDLWLWLALVEFDGYVRWRFARKDGEATVIDRFTGPEYKHAIARLWWGAELARNGPDYGPVVKMFEVQDFQNSWMRYDAMHNRAMAIAAIRLLSTFRNGGMATGDQINELGRTTNFALAAAVLDAVVPDSGPDPIAVADWIASKPAEVDLLAAELPRGPEEDPVPEPSVVLAEEMLRRLAAQIDLPTVTKKSRQQRIKGRQPVPAVAA